MKVAITGPSGHVGINLCKALIEAGHEVSALMREPNAEIERIGVQKLINGDLFNTDSLDRLVAGSDVVFHLAAGIAIHKNDPVAYETNLSGTENILKASRKSSAKRFIHFSSIHVYKRVPFDRELNESRELETDSIFDYVRSKARAEQMVLEANGNDIETIVLSPTAVIGPFDYKPSLLGDAIIRFYKNKAPALIPGGYNWVDVRDVCAASVNAMAKARAGERYILSGHWHSLKVLAEVIHKLGGAKPPAITVPVVIARASAPLLNLYSKILNQTPLYTSVTLDAVAKSHRNISSEKAKKELAYRPRPFEETVADTIRWLKDENFI